MVPGTDLNQQEDFHYFALVKIKQAYHRFKQNNFPAIVPLSTENF